MQKHIDIRTGGFSSQQRPVFFAESGKMLADFIELLQVQAGIVRSIFKRGDHTFGRRLGGAPGERRKSGIQNIHPGQRGRIIAHRRHTAGAMGMQVDRNMHPFFDGFDQVVRHCGEIKPAISLMQIDSQPSFSSSTAILAKPSMVVDRADRIANRPLNMGADTFWRS